LGNEGPRGEETDLEQPKGTPQGLFG
jgi:hypothetical protein